MGQWEKLAAKVNAERGRGEEQGRKVWGSPVQIGGMGGMWGLCRAAMGGM